MKFDHLNRDRRQAVFSWGRESRKAGKLIGENPCFSEYYRGVWAAGWELENAAIEDAANNGDDK